MKTFKNNQNLFTNSEWFLAVILSIGPKEDITCRNYPCSWNMTNYCNDLETVDLDNPGLIYGSWEENYNIAYPINEISPSVGDIVLMRFRGQIDENNNVYEFFLSGSGGSSNAILALTALQCSGGILSATYSEGCVYQ